MCASCGPKSRHGWTLRFAEKDGKAREIPVRHDLQKYILAYLAAVPDWQERGGEPMFRTTVRRTRFPTSYEMSTSTSALR